MPHGHCYLWQPSLVWTHVISDFLIGLAYLSISISLYALIRKIKLPFSAVVVSFGVFIGACGATHFMEVWNLWRADYWAAGWVKVVTAIASVTTGVWLFKLMPNIIAVAEAARVSLERKELLEKLNSELEARSAELKATNDRLAEQQKALAHSAKMSALGEMAGGIAHEINSPLGIITLHANQIERLQKRGTLTPETIAREAQLIASTAKRIGDIIKGLRAFAREGEKDPFLVTPVQRILDDVLVLCRNRFSANDTHLKIGEIPPGLDIECRPVQVIQIILNLLNNAFDAAQPSVDNWVSIEIRETEGMCRFQVTDSGPGMTAEVASKIFQPFFTTKGVGKGTGLGLSISKGIAEAHHGSLECRYSTLPTQFTLAIPLRQPYDPSKAGGI